MSFISMKPTREWTKNCRDCNQRISKLVETGHIVNDVTGKGGRKGEDHICPNRLGTGSVADEERIKKTFVCVRCSHKFSGKYVDCPRCFKLTCQACGAMQDWRMDAPKNTCIQCAHKYLAWTTISEYVSDGVYRPKTKEELKWKKVLFKFLPKQETGCAQWGHILREGDKKCRVCEVGVIR